MNLKVLPVAIGLLFELIFVKKDTLATIQALVAPVFVPLAPAVFLGSEVYKTLVVDTVHWLALTAAVMSAVGVEAVGGLSSYTAVLKAQRREWGKMWLAVLVIGIYIVTLFAAMWWFNAPALGFFALLTPGAFIIAALFNVDEVAKQEVAQVTDTQIKLLTAEKNLTNAQARKMRQENEAGQQLDMSVLLSSKRPAQSGQRTDSLTEIGQRVYDYLDKHYGKGSAREIAAACECGKSQANTWAGKWREKNGTTNSG